MQSEQINNNKSEVARLLGQISSEYEAAKRALCGLSLGGNRHRFITTRMENLGKLGEQLDQLLGEGKGIAMVITALDDLPDQATNPSLID